MRPPALVAFLLAAPAALAQPAPAESPLIIVTGGPLEAPPGTAAYGSVLIERERLESAASGRLEDVLRDVAGFQQFRRADSRAANPTAQGVTLRALGGNASSRALVLLDGVPVADPFAGYINFASLAPERLADVRVTRGGGVGPFGAGAVAGVIELASASAADLPRLSARGLYGSRDSVELAAGAAPAIGRGFLTLDARYDRGDGYVLVPPAERGPVDVPARYEAASASLRGVAPLGEAGELQARATLFTDERLRGITGTENTTEGVDASLRYLRRGGWAVDAVLYGQVRNFTSGFVSVNEARTTATPTLDQYRTPATGLGGKIELRPPTGGDNVLRLGIDGRYADGATNERFRFQSGAPTRNRRAGGDNAAIGLFVEDDLVLGDLILTGGARVDHWRIANGFLRETDLASGAVTQLLEFADRSGWEPSFRAGALWRPAPSLGLRAAAYTGWRQPTLNELYRPFRVGADATAANAALTNERLRGVEGGLDFNPLPALRFRLTAFHNRLEDAIANVTLARGPGVFPQVGFVAGTGVFRQRLNVEAVRATGVEIAGLARYGDISLSASYAFTAARVEAGGAAAELDGRRPAQTPRHQVSATAAWAPSSGAELALTVRHVAEQFEDDLETRALPAATTLDAYARLPVKWGISLIGRAENLTDAEVVSGISGAGIRDLAQPRTFWIGVAYAL